MFGLRHSAACQMLVLGRAAGVHFIFATQRPDEVVMSPLCAAASPDALHSRWLLKRIRA